MSNALSPDTLSWHSRRNTSWCSQNAWCSQNGQTHVKNPASFAATCVCPFCRHQALYN